MQVNREGIQDCLNKGENGFNCTDCDIHKAHEEGRVCSNCMIAKRSKREGDDSRIERGLEPLKSRIGIKKPFTEFGIPIDKYTNYGKHHMYFYLYYPKFEFEWPPVPETDCVGNFVNTETVNQWCVHHINGIHHDDRKINQCLCLNKEHRHLHTLYEHGKYEEAKEFMIRIAHRNFEMFGEYGCPITGFENFEETING